MNDGVLDQKKNNYLASIYFEKNQFGISFLDVSTGDFYISQGDFKLIDQLISNFSPNEILVSKPSKNKLKELIGNSYNVYPLDDWVFDSSYSKSKLLNHFKTKSLKGFGVDDIKLGIIAAGSVIHYLDDTEHNNLSHISNLRRIFPDSYVWMDKFTMKNLELFNSNSSNGFNLSETIDDTITSMGSRRLKTRWIDQGAIEAVVLIEVPNRYLAGIAEVKLKEKFSDKTNWRRMLTSNIEEEDITNNKKMALDSLGSEFEEFFKIDSEVLKFNYQIDKSIDSVKSISLKKSDDIEGILVGVKGQYLIFDDSSVFNVRSNEGYVVDISISD